MTLVMYAAKAGASGVGSVDTACKKELIYLQSKRIKWHYFNNLTKSCIQTLNIILKMKIFPVRCRWTDMAPIHYATYFDVSPVLTTLLHHTKVFLEIYKY